VSDAAVVPPLRLRILFVSESRRRLISSPAKRLDGGAEMSTKIGSL